MKRRMLSICLALALCLSLLPGTALAAAPAHLALGDSITTGYAPGGATVGSPFADQVTAGLGHDLIAETISDTTPDTPSGPAEEYDIWVGGTLVTRGNAGDVLGDGTVAYDPDTNTLTLRDANITTAHEAGNYSCGIYTEGKLTIELEGQSTVGSNSFYYGVYMNGDLTITGTGSLNAVGSTTGVYVFGNMEVIDSKVTGTSAEHLGIVVWGELTVNGGKVTGTCNSASGFGIQVESSLTVNGGEVSGTGNIGIYTRGPLDMTAGTVTAEGANGYGLRVNNGSIQTDATSTVTATSVAGRAIYNSSIWVNRVEYELAAGVTEFRVAGGVVVTDAVQVKVEALYVNNEDVLTANNNTVTCGGGTAVYDPDTNTLTLRDAVITGAYPESGDNYGIYAKGQLTIELVGQSTVVKNEGNPFTTGVYVADDLIITGTGSLTAAGSEKGIHVSGSLEVTGGIVAGEGRYGIDVSSLEVTGGTVTGIGENGAGVRVDGNLTVDGADGMVHGTDGSEGDGIYVSGSLEVTGGTVTGTSTGGDGIRTEGYLAAYDNSTVSGEGNNGIRTEGYLEADDSTVSGEGNNDGIAAEGGLYVDYSIVTAQGATGCGLRASEILIGYFEDTSNVTASSQVAGRAVESSSIQVNLKEYTMAEGATEFKVVNGAVVAGAESVLLEALYVNNVDVLTAPGYTVQCGSGTAVYDSDTNTLTLRNATITEGYEVLYGEAPYGIYAKGKLTICLEGASTVARENASFYYGVFMDGDLTITGSGSLTAKGSHAGISAENLTVTGGTVDGIGEDEYGIYTDGLTVNGGTLNGRGGFYGIRIAGNLTVNSGTVDGAGDSGIWITDGNLTVNGGTVSGTGEEDYGIFADSLTVTGGTVTGKGDMVAIFGVKSGTGLAAGDIIVLPAGYLPAGYVLQAVEEGVRTYASIVPAGGQLGVNSEGLSITITGAVREITLRAQQPSEPEWPSGGGSSGGSSTTTETQQNPDGSTTTTVTRPNGSTTETTRHPDGSSEVVETTKDGTVTTTTTDTEGNQTQVVENTDGSSRTTVDNQDGSGSVTTVDENGQVVSEATLSEAAVAAAHTAGEPVALPMPAVPVTTDRESAPTVTVNLPTSGSAKVEIPVKDVTPGTVAILIKADGTEEVLKASLPTENGVAVPLSDGDTVKLVDNSKKFADVPGSYWAADTIAFVTSRELFAGTTADTFAPDTAMSRAMIVTVLARLEGMDTATGDTWYEAGRQWAMASGVSDGTNMEQGLSREQLATMLWRYAQAKGYDVSIGEDTNILSYTDAFDVAEYAIPAMQWAVGAGIISGTSTDTLSPQGPATRAQVATMLMRFCEKTASW